jgi:hypothetical protein
MAHISLPNFTASRHTPHTVHTSQSEKHPNTNSFHLLPCCLQHRGLDSTGTLPHDAPALKSTRTRHSPGRACFYPQRYIYIYIVLIHYIYHLLRPIYPSFGMDASPTNTTYVFRKTNSHYRPQFTNKHFQLSHSGAVPVCTELFFVS